MKKNRIWFVRLALLLMISVLLVSWTAAAGTATLTVVPTAAKTEATRSGETIFICRITSWTREKGHELTKEFASSHISVEKLLGEDANTYATQIHKYVKEQNISSLSKVTDQSGAAVFSGVEDGIYLVFPKTVDLFAPFLVTVQGSDLKCKPKMNPDPNPTQPTEPTHTTTPSTTSSNGKPVPDTSDSTDSVLYAVGLGIGLFGLVLVIFVTRKKE